MRRAVVVLAVLGLGLSLTRCEPAEKVDEKSALFEAWLQDRGLAPLNEAQATEMFSDKTFYGRYGGAEGGWIEYYSRGGVSVFQPAAEQNPKRRIVYFGTWWAETQRTCFSYPEQKLDCYRVYRDDGSVYFVRTEDKGFDRPAGSLSAAANRIEKGNTENYPFVAN
jgi:hypothetical protein